MACGEHAIPGKTALYSFEDAVIGPSRGTTAANVELGVGRCHSPASVGLIEERLHIVI
jgi:hypothetical protein